MLPRARGEDIQGLLLKAGAGLDARDFSGKTLFFRTASDTNVHRIPDDTIPILQRLVHLGATPTTRDFKGKTCLHEVVGLLGNRQRLKRVECAAWKRWDMLIEMGLDPKDVDYEGNSLLHTVAQRETKGNAVPVLKYLVDSTGLDVNQVNVSPPNCLLIVLRQTAFFVLLFTDIQGSISVEQLCIRYAKLTTRADIAPIGTARTVPSPSCWRDQITSIPVIMEALLRYTWRQRGTSF